jgi:ribose-phosphate pyrophosphokinase
MELQFFCFKDQLEWGRKIEEHLEIPIALHEEREFEDGEHKTRSLENVRNRDVFVIESLYSDGEQTVNDKICRLLFFINALKDASAKHVTAVIPYFAYARKDQKSKSRDPVTMKYMAKLLEAAGADSILSMDIHNLAAYQNAFRIPVENLEAQTLFAPYLAKHLASEDIVIVAPDLGGIKRADKLRETLSELIHKEIGIAVLSKKRSSGLVEGGSILSGEVKNKVTILVDDILSTGKTLRLGVEALSLAGASRILACVTHGILLQESKDLIDDERIETIVISDTIHSFYLDPLLINKKIHILDSSLLFARAMKRMQAGESIIDLMENFSRN